jgi:hypothetical protein
VLKEKDNGFGNVPFLHDAGAEQGNLQDQFSGLVHSSSYDSRRRNGNRPFVKKTKQLAGGEV